MRVFFCLSVFCHVFFFRDVRTARFDVDFMCLADIALFYVVFASFFVKEKPSLVQNNKTAYTRNNIINNNSSTGTNAEGSF